MAFEYGQAIKILLGEMFTEINLVFSTLGYYHNTYDNWHTINGALNQELLQRKHNPDFSANLDKKTGFGKVQQGFVIFPVYWAPVTLTNKHHLQAEEVRRGTAKSAASTTTDKDPQAVKAQQTQLPPQRYHITHTLLRGFSSTCAISQQPTAETTAPTKRILKEGSEFGILPLRRISSSPKHSNLTGQRDLSSNKTL